MKYEKIDLHTHYITPSYRAYSMEEFGPKPEGYPTPEWDVEKQLHYMDANRVSYALLTTANPYPYYRDTEKTKDLIRRCNSELAALTAPHKDRLGFTATLPIHDVEASCAEAVRVLDELGASGFCLSTNVAGLYLGDPKLDPLMEVFNARKTLVAVHPITPAAVPKGVCERLPIPCLEFFYDCTRTFTNLVMENVFRRYPDIRWVFPHAGAFLSVFSDRFDFFAPGLKNPRDGSIPDFFGALRHVWFDVAGFAEPKLLSLLLQVADERHIVFGSDFPYIGEGKCLDLAASLEGTDKLTEAQRINMFTENAKTLLGLA